MSNRKRTVLYVGVTNSLLSRITQHKFEVGSRFTAKYKCHYLLHFESFHTIDEAIRREKQLKKWRREWKWNLIKKHNPELVDLYNEILDFD